MRVVTRVVSTFGHAGAGTTQYTNRDINYDVAIAGIPFILATNDQRPFQRSTAPLKKDQFDASSEPGEQSLVGWWLRSQSSFHGGAGVKYADVNDANPMANIRFEASAGVDVWTPGNVALLRDTTKDATVASGAVLLRGFNASSTDYVLTAHGTTLRYVNDSGSTAVTWGGAGTIKSITDDGASYYVADGTVIQKGALPGGAGALLYNAAGTNVVLGWTHQRLIAGIDNKVYELVAAGPGLPAVKYTHPSSSWIWTSVADAPGAILMGGYSGSTSAIYKFTLDSSGAMPTLSGGVLAASLPTGETVRSLAVYLGNILVVGTSKGVRIGTLNYNQDITLGPLTVQTPAPVLGLTGRERFVYATYSRGIDGSSGLLRIDLSQQISNGRYAWASDVYASTEAGDVTSVAILGNSDRMCFGANNAGVYLEHSTRLITQGYLRTGRIRFNTLEPKLYKLIRVRATTLAGAMTVSSVDSSGSEVSLINYAQSSLPGGQEVTISSPVGPQELIQVKLILNRGTDTTQGAAFTSYQIKALPGSPRKRMLKIPVLLFDEITLRNGSRLTRRGWAWKQLSALESVEELGDIVVYQDLSTGDSVLGTVESLDFEQKSPPGPRGEGVGGILYITLRTV